VLLAALSELMYKGFFALEKGMFSIFAADLDGTRGFFP